VQFALCLVRSGKLRIDGPCTLNACIGLIETTQFDERACGQAEEIGIIRVLIEPIRADGFGRLVLTTLQEVLRFPELPCYFPRN
jgi:hypothetical protein